MFTFRLLLPPSMNNFKVFTRNSLMKSWILTYQSWNFCSFKSFSVFKCQAGRPHLRISLYQQRISENFLSLISVKSFASSRVRTADLESHSPLLYHRAKQNCCETKLLTTINKLSLNSQGSQGPENFSKFLRWVPPATYLDVVKVLISSFLYYR